jgi:ribosomal protein S25
MSGEPLSERIMKALRDPMTVEEAARKVDVDPSIVLNVMLRLASEGKIKLVDGERWQARYQVVKR